MIQQNNTKVIVGKTEEAQEMQTFGKTPEGDGHMPWHITVCMMTSADGKRANFLLIVEM